MPISTGVRRRPDPTRTIVPGGLASALVAGIVAAVVAAGSLSEPPRRAVADSTKTPLAPRAHGS